MHSVHELESRALHHEVIANVSRKAIAADDIQTLFDDAVRQIADTLGVEYVKVLELLPDGQSLLVRAGVGWDPGIVGKVRVPADAHSQAGYTLFANRAVDGGEHPTHEPIIVDNLTEETRFEAPRLLREHGVVSGVSVIIYGSGRAYGVLGAHTSRRRRFTQDDADFLQVMANVLGAACRRHESEEALRENEARLSAILNSAAEAIITSDRDGTILSVNNAVDRIFGYAPGELIGRSINVLMPEPHRSQHDSYIANYLETAVSDFMGFRRELEGQRKDGTLFPLEIVLNETSANGDTFFTTLIRDVTVEKEHRQSLDRARRWFEQLTTTTPDIVFVYNVPEKRNIYVNKTLVPALDATLNELASMNSKAFERLIHPEDAARVRRFFAAFAGFPGDDVRELVCRCRGTDGGYRWYQSRCVPFERDAGGGIRLVLVVARDITSMKRVEAELEKHQARLAELNKALEQRVQERTNALERNADQLRRLTNELVQAEQRERSRIARLLHDDLQQVLVAAKLRSESAARQAPGQPEWREVLDLLREAIASTRSLARHLHPPALFENGLGEALEWLGTQMKRKYGLRVITDVSAEAAPLPEAIQVVLFHTVRELLFNVVKHAGVSEARVRVDNTADGRLHLQVADDGAGADPAVIESDTDHFGLFSARQQIIALGGDVQIATASGDGLKVDLYVPLGSVNADAGDQAR